VGSPGETPPPHHRLYGVQTAVSNGNTEPLTVTPTLLLIYSVYAPMVTKSSPRL
jgi:hypothetical protein